VDAPRRRLDPLAAAIYGAALAALLGVGGYLVVSLWRYQPPLGSPKPAVAPMAAPASAERTFELVDLRPRKEKIDFNPGDEYGYVVVGDERFDRVAALRDRLAEQAGHVLEGKQVQVQQLLTWYVRTPQTPLVETGPGLKPMPPEQVWQIPDLRKHRYWAICVVAVVVDGRRASGRGVSGFNAETEFGEHHRRALLQAINGVAARL
jgi:hypothetical protein